MTDPQSTARTVRRQGRSPSYPAISLDRAIERADQIYRKEKQYPTPAEALAKSWGYASTNGPAGAAIAALKKFGLLTDEGVKADRRVKLTDLAVQILAHPSSDARQEGIRTAALAPAIHRELWDEYGPDLPSDANLIWTLTKDRGFTDTGANEFVSEYRETILFAGMDKNPTASATFPVVAVDDDDVEIIESATEPTRRGYQFPESVSEQIMQMNREQANPQTRQLPSSPNLETFKVPMPRGESVTVQGSFPLSQRGWDQLMRFFEFSKPVLVDGSEELED